MTPVEALERIADLLVRGGEPAYKAQAFRRAAREIRHVPIEELERLDEERHSCKTCPESATRPRR